MNTEDKFDPYQIENVPLFEALYGKNLISLGGIDAIENMFSDIELRDKKILDIGFGIGGVPYYLSEKYDTEVFAVEIHQWMVKHAYENTPPFLANKLHFSIYDDGNVLPYPEAVFDLAYSKGVLNHVQDKVSLFRQVYSKLKENGIFVIADWIHPTSEQEKPSSLVNETKLSYKLALNRAGFRVVEFRNDSAEFEIYVQMFLENLKTQQEFIELHYGLELFKTIQRDHDKLLRKIKNRTKIAMRIVAKK